MSLFRNYRRYRNLRNLGFRRRVAWREFQHQRMTKLDAILIAFFPIISLTVLMYGAYHVAKVDAYFSRENAQRAVNEAAQHAAKLDKAEQVIVSILNGQPVRVDYQTTRFGRCNAATGCP